jgi:hypothetical protein
LARCHALLAKLVGDLRMQQIFLAAVLPDIADLGTAILDGHRNGLERQGIGIQTLAVRL